MSDELKPCPFCGGEAKAFYCEESGTFDVQCQQCGAIPFIGSRTSERRTMADVIAAWNARAAVTDEQFSLAVHDGRAWQVLRECEMVEMPTGEKAAYSDTDEIIWHCRFCHAERAVYEFGEDGDVWAAAPKFCPECGAKEAKPPELTCHMNHVLLYDEDVVDGIECDECGWIDVHDLDEPMPERCPGCKAKVVSE